MPKSTFINITLLCVVILAGCASFAPTREAPRKDSVAHAFEQHQTRVVVEGEGVVFRILADDLEGSPHQRFILRIASGQTVLIEHNTNLAPRIDDLHVGDQVTFSGEYIWNHKGGLIHWTHHDPAGKRPSGWIKHNGHTYK